LPDFNHITIDTPRLTLRPLSVQDAEPLLAIFSDADVMRYWNTPPWSSTDDAHTFINTHHAAMSQGEWVTLGIFTKEDELIGKCMLFNYDSESRRAELGFGIAKSAWGKGYIQEAGKALIEFGFTTMNLRRLEAEIDPQNSASGKALEKMGFIKEGLLRERWEINGVISDSGLYGLLKSDFQKSL